MDIDRKDWGANTFERQEEDGKGESHGLREKTREAAFDRAG
jgi:hypothetical protein